MSGILTDVTTKRWMQRETKLARDVGQLAINSKSIEVDNPNNLVVRDILPADDLNSGANNAWNDTSEANTTEEWQQDWATGTGTSTDAYNEAYTIDSSSNAEDKIIGFMGLSVLHPNNETHQVRFQMGQSGNQGVKREFNIESLETDRESRAMFLTDVIYDAKEHGTVDFYNEANNDGDRVILHGYVAEAVGETLSEPSNPMLASGGNA